MMMPWTPLVALAATLLPLVLVKRWITRSLQELSIRWIGDADVALVLYFTLILPGVLIHEISHGLTALILGVRVQRFSIGPVRKGRSTKVSLGSVQIGKADPLRASLIGLAPLLAGSAVILLIGVFVLGVDELAAVVATQDVDGILASLTQVAGIPDFWIWLYLIFAVSNAMLPSESDMATVRPVLIFLGIVTVIVLVVAGVPAIPEGVVQFVNAVAGYLASAFAVTLAVDAVFMFFILVLLWLTRRIKRRRRDY